MHSMACSRCEWEDGAIAMSVSGCPFGASLTLARWLSLCLWMCMVRMEGRVVQADPKKGYYINYVGW